MKIKHTSNGNHEGENQYNKLISTVLINPESRDWVAINNLNSLLSLDDRRENVRCVANINNYSQFVESSELFISGDKVVLPSKASLLVCNAQYRLNEEIDENFTSLLDVRGPVNLNAATESLITSTYLDDSSNILSSEIPSSDEQRAFCTSDPDEMRDRVKGAPRGIVNPNYPGFQHLAHTLQDYSSTIENFYQSENDMTDDDVEITDLTYEADSKSNDMNIECKNNYNDSDVYKLLDSDDTLQQTIIQQDETTTTYKGYEKDQMHSSVPDLIKTVTQNSNIDTFYDIENNFRTRDIIGDFNKEIEDEIKNVLNYNLNIQDDLEELRKDIKENLEEPIVNTINNISEVVNHVIKKMVETHCDSNIENKLDLGNETVTECSSCITAENAAGVDKVNAKEMNRNRPTFLYIESNDNSKIADAVLSDGKEDINICEDEYDTDQLTDDVENTIKQLSTELRKIIPKLDEMRERDKFFSVNMNKPSMIVTDGNCNQIPGPPSHKDNVGYLSKVCKMESSGWHEQKENNIHMKNRKVEMRRKPHSRTLRDRLNNQPNSLLNSDSKIQNQTVPKNEPKEECFLGNFDVYNIETALPKLDLDAIESHLKAAKEAERRKRNDREEIRRRLAMGAESEENYYSLGHIDRPGRKPSLQSRMQSGMNLQICFMNETASDNESQLSEIESTVNSNKNLTKSSIFSKSNYSLNNHPYQTRPLSVSISKQDKISTVQSGAKLRPSSLSLKTPKSRSTNSLGHIELRESDFQVLQATLQTEARMALASAKEMARVQMERERRTRAASPVTEMLRRSMEKASAPLAADRRRVSRHILTDMNIAQLQVIVNELHGQIESLNESLVSLLLARDELHMRQDSVLVDIEDLTRYLGVKEQSKKTKGTNKSAVRRLASLVSK